jgi:hypothetical protein
VLAASPATAQWVYGSFFVGVFQPKVRHGAAGKACAFVVGDTHLTQADFPILAVALQAGGSNPPLIQFFFCLFCHDAPGVVMLMLTSRVHVTMDSDASQPSSMRKTRASSPFTNK